MHKEPTSVTSSHFRLVFLTKLDLVGDSSRYRQSVRKNKVWVYHLKSAGVASPNLCTTFAHVLNNCFPHCGAV